MQSRYVLRAFVLLCAGLLMLSVSACGRASGAKTIILGTTTSIQDSGLLDVLLPVFKEQTGYFVKTIAVGSGQAMSMGARGEVDVLLVHSEDDERAFMAAGNGLRRLLVMHNDFIILGPADDPAGIRAAPGAPEAFRMIAEQKAVFISRGDNSGTHAKEKVLWHLAGVAPDGRNWYQQTGLGMGHSLAVASEKNAYILADRGTWLALRKNVELAVVCTGDASLLNIYHVIEINPERWPKVNTAGARAFADFLTAPEAQKLIGSFGVETFGEALFVPDAGKTVESLGT